VTNLSFSWQIRHSHLLLPFFLVGKLPVPSSILNLLFSGRHTTSFLVFLLLFFFVSCDFYHSVVCHSLCIVLSTWHVFLISSLLTLSLKILFVIFFNTFISTVSTIHHCFRPGFCCPCRYWFNYVLVNSALGILLISVCSSIQHIF
jgi:hypothetical protein